MKWQKSSNRLLVVLFPTHRLLFKSSDAGGAFERSALASALQFSTRERLQSSHDGGTAPKYAWNPVTRWRMTSVAR